MDLQKRSSQRKDSQVKTKKRSARYFVKQAFLALATLLFTIVVIISAFTIITPHFGWVHSIVYSGSMEPAINVGGIVIIRPVDTDTVRVGDVITFKVEGNDDLMITHRVVEVTNNGIENQFLTKGDANEGNDIAPVSSEDVVGKVWLDIPYLGYLMDFMHKPLGFGLVIGIPAIIIVLMEIRSMSLSIKELRRKRRREIALNRRRNQKQGCRLTGNEN